MRLGIQEGFRINVDMIFGMPGEGPADVERPLALARELADLGARIHAHTFMPLPGTPWRDAPPGDVDPDTAREVDRLSRRGALYGHWQTQREHAGTAGRRGRGVPAPWPQPHAAPAGPAAPRSAERPRGAPAPANASARPAAPTPAPRARLVPWRAASPARSRRRTRGGRGREHAR